MYFQEPCKYTLYRSSADKLGNQIVDLHVVQRRFTLHLDEYVLRDEVGEQIHGL